MQSEVRREGSLLEGGELRARQGAESDYAPDEGLEECAADESAITVTGQISASAESCGLCEIVPEQMIRSRILEGRERSHCGLRKRGARKADSSTIPRDDIDEGSDLR